MQGQKILLVDDDEALRQSLAEQLELHEEFKTVEVESGTQALQALAEERFDLVLLDIGLPDMDGRETCRLMRRAGVRVPIILLTGADTDSDTILGFESGANDYVTKPFRLGVLMARIRSHLRQHEQSEDAIFRIGRFRFHPAEKLLHEKQTGAKLRLTGKETSILKFLYRAGDQVVDRETLLAEVWGYGEGINTHTLETHIYRLRQKIERDPASAEILVTQDGGYRLIP